MPGPETPCAFCGGHGKDPFGIMSWQSTCCVCGGRGRVRVAAPSRPCRHCRGTGAVKTLTCTVCGGKGRVPAPRGPTLPCPTCRASGDNPAAPPWPALPVEGAVGGKIWTGAALARLPEPFRSS